jgi:diacylglycerol kinase family enzyme
VVALRDGEAVLVDVGVAGRRPFVNTSSTGIYVDLVQAREGSGWRTRWARRPPRSSCYFSYCDVVGRTS